MDEDLCTSTLRVRKMTRTVEVKDKSLRYGNNYTEDNLAFQGLTGWKQAQGPPHARSTARHPPPECDTFCLLNFWHLRGAGLTWGHRFRFEGRTS